MERENDEEKRERERQRASESLSLCVPVILTLISFHMKREKESAIEECRYILSQFKSARIHMLTLTGSRSDEDMKKMTVKRERGRAVKLVGKFEPRVPVDHKEIASRSKSEVKSQFIAD